MVLSPKGVVAFPMIILGNAANQNVEPAQAALAQEKAERARIVMSLRETIGGLKAAGTAEARLKADLAHMQDALAAARSGQVRWAPPSLQLTFCGCRPRRLPKKPGAVGTHLTRPRWMDNVALSLSLCLSPSLSFPPLLVPVSLWPGR